MKKAVFLSLIIILTVVVGSHSALAAPSKWAEESVTEAISLHFVPSELQYDYSAPTTRCQFARISLHFMATEIGFLDFDSDYISFFNLFCEQHISLSGTPYKKEDYVVNPELKLTEYTSWSQLCNQEFFADVTWETCGSDSTLINMAYILGVVQGRGNGNFDPDSPITRQEAAVMLERVYRLCDGGTSVVPMTGLSYQDSDEIADWAQASVTLLTNLAIIQGSDNDRFMPDDTYTVEQCIVTFNRLFPLAQVSLQPICDLETVKKSIRDYWAGANISIIFEQTAENYTLWWIAAGGVMHPGPPRIYIISTKGGWVGTAIDSFPTDQIWLDEENNLLYFEGSDYVDGITHPWYIFDLNTLTLTKTMSQPIRD